MSRKTTQTAPKQPKNTKKHSAKQHSKGTATAVQSGEAQQYNAENAGLWAEKAKTVKLDVSKATLNRHISSLIRQKKIIVVKYKDFRKYGLPETDKKARYLTLAKNASLPKYYNLVLSSLKSEDPIKKKNALIELESMNSIALLPNQLTNLALNLLKEDCETGERIIRVLYNNFNNAILPSNLDKLQNNIITFYEKNKGKVNQNVKAHVMFMLGILGNEKIVEFLKEDILKNKTFENLKNEGYVGWFVANVIDEAKTELLNFQNTLKDHTMIQITFQVRNEARRDLTMRAYGFPDTIYETGMKRFRPKIKEMEQ